jgi:hypothetical protein
LIREGVLEVCLGRQQRGLLDRGGGLLVSPKGGERGGEEEKKEEKGEGKEGKKGGKSPFCSRLLALIVQCPR